ncbi:hypothetical protein L1049_028339 [Liquidambar formosana]|uniref:Vomeronasal type 2 receptor n=1 Tax=Liquidambar formosana TaxID=63359 RepID=A0AAP0RKC9_LIQFO
MAPLSLSWCCLIIFIISSMFFIPHIRTCLESNVPLTGYSSAAAEKSLVPILNSLCSAVDLQPTFLCAALSSNDSLEWKFSCFYKNRAWMEFHNKVAANLVVVLFITREKAKPWPPGLDYSKFCPLHRYPGHNRHSCFTLRDIIYDMNDQNRLDSDGFVCPSLANCLCAPYRSRLYIVPGLQRLGRQS